MDVLKSLDESPAVDQYEVDQFRSWANGRHYKLQIFLRDGSVLYAREYVDDKERCYSFHWQTERGELIRRWDNAPHYRHLSTYPHHCHEENTVLKSQPPTLADILEYIQRKAIH
ncbi:MAG: DUF6516 family protein [Verrucomicrobia bacterium]|nr:DUF6516 family protein [Verrucomicrobiota bacterium]